MGARSTLMCGTITGLLIGLLLIVAGSVIIILSHDGTITKPRYITGGVMIPCGVLIIGAYCYLSYGVYTKDPEHLPKGACKWCCYGPLVWSCIENYRKELSPA